jgi:uncharacterized membrane protein YqaE (UPF0057 family)
MKKIICNGILLVTMFGLFTNSISAASIVIENNNPHIFIPCITPAPKVIIPFAPIEPAKVSTNEALKEFKTLSRSERKERIKEVKAAIKEYKKQKKAGDEPSTNQLLMVILCILLPPLAVYLHEGEVNTKFWISVLLTLLFWLPGIIYALVVVLEKD